MGAEQVEYPTAYHFEWYETRPGYKVFVDRIVSWCQDKKGTITNVGCGDGLLESLILKQNPQVWLLGIDTNADAIALCQKLVQDERVTFIQADGFVGGWGSHYVLCIEVLEHVENRTLPDMVYQLARRCLKGMYLTTPNGDYPDGDSAKRNDCHFCEYSLAEVTRELEKYFDRVDVTEIDGDGHYVCEGRNSNG